MSWTLLLVCITVVAALTFDFLNGFHDAANSIATVVSTRVLSPRLAVLWAAFFNFVAAFLLGTAVAKMIGKGMIQLDIVTQYVVLGGLAGAIAWDLLTWWWGLPTSSSHALIGGYAGAAMARAAFVHGPARMWDVIIAAGWNKTLIFIVVAPLLGLALGWIFMIAVFWIFRHRPPQQIDRWFRRLQLFSAACYSLGHGGNDAQKTMGIVAGALFTAGIMSKEAFAADWGPPALADHPGGARRHRPGDLLRRVADRPYHGFEDHQAEAGRRLLRRDGRGDHAFRHRAGRDPGQHHAYDHGSDRRRGRDLAPLGGALGSRAPDRVGVGADHPRVGGSGCGHFCADPPVLCGSVSA